MFWSRQNHRNADMHAHWKDNYVLLRARRLDKNKTEKAFTDKKLELSLNVT